MYSEPLPVESDSRGGVGQGLLIPSDTYDRARLGHADGWGTHLPLSLLTAVIRRRCGSRRILDILQSQPKWTCNLNGNGVLVLQRQNLKTSPVLPTTLPLNPTFTKIWCGFGIYSGSPNSWIYPMLKGGLVSLGKILRRGQGLGLRICSRISLYSSSEVQASSCSDCWRLFPWLVWWSGDCGWVGWNQGIPWGGVTF